MNHYVFAQPAPAGFDSGAVEDLEKEAIAVALLGATVLNSTDIGPHALEYAIRGWSVLPLRGKVPAIAGGRGVYGATVDASLIANWWGGRYAGCNIGIRPLKTVFVLDIDPQHGGHHTLEALEAEHGPLPDTLTTWTGRGDGSRHLYFRRPNVKLTSAALPGVDIKDDSGYLVAAPSIHPDTGQPYRRVDAPVAAPPAWLVNLISTPAKPAGHQTSRPRPAARAGLSVADAFNRDTSWPQILSPHGWTCLDADPDADGARWRHPNATSASSASVRHRCLFVYSPNTPFDVTSASDPHGYTKFRAYATLNHGGDLKAAARILYRQFGRR